MSSNPRVRAQRARRVRVTGILELPRPIDVRNDVLGSSIEARFGQQAVRLYFPTSQSALGGSLLEASSGSPGRYDHLSSTRLRWGYRVASDVNEVRALRVSTLDGKKPEHPSDIERMAEGLATWCKDFCDWCDVWNAAKARHAEIQGTHIMMVAADGRSFVGARVKGGFHTEFASGPPLTVERVVEASRRASRGHALPLEHQLLLTAHDATLVDTRRMVIDAATAVEVALSSSVRNELSRKGLAAAAIQTILIQAGGIVGLAALYEKSTSRKLPVSMGKIRSEIAKHRNDAVHRGEGLSLDSAYVLRDRAHELVHFITPVL